MIIRQFEHRCNTLAGGYFQFRNADKMPPGYGDDRLKLRAGREPPGNGDWQCRE
jgi:hypothetical protein